MKHCLKHRAEQLLLAASRPELRHSMRYECGLYKSSSDRSPMVSACMEHSCAISILRLVAMMAGLALLAMAMRSLVCSWRKRKWRRQCRMSCD